MPNLLPQPTESPVLDSDTKKRLRSMVFALKTQRRLWLRASIVWGLAKGVPLAEVSARFGVTPRTARKWWERFVSSGINVLHDRPRSGAPPKFTVGQRCEVIAIAGTQSLLAAFHIQTGQVTAHCGPGRTTADLGAFMEAVAGAYQDAKRIIVIWHNLNIHHDGSTNRWTEFNQRHGGKFEFVYTPVHAS